MPRGLSYHFGVNHVDVAHYQARYELKYCAEDAIEMATVAESCGFEANVLTNEYATSYNLFSVLYEAAHILMPGDILFISFSGHGSQVQDMNGDEDDGNDEALVMYDRFVVDDELYQAWLRFRPGVRVLFISDSCNSGTVTKGWRSFFRRGRQKNIEGPMDEVYKLHRDQYDPILKNIPAKMVTPIQCSVLLLSACQDNEPALAESKDGIALSPFTAALTACWAGGAFRGSYKDLYNETCLRMRRAGMSQRPNYFLIGKPHPEFEYQIPFTI